MLSKHGHLLQKKTSNRKTTYIYEDQLCIVVQLPKSPQKEIIITRALLKLKKKREKKNPLVYSAQVSCYFREK